MISKRTLLVLGAGSNKELGFPLGTELKDIIYERLSNPHDATWRSYLAQLGFKKGLIDEYIQCLRKCQFYTIDEFIFHFPDYSRIAKASISLALIPCEDPRKLDNLDSNKWYRFFYNNIMKGVTSINDFRNNQLSIYTFNYDRSLEKYLYECFMIRFPGEDPYMLLTHLNIFHVHGQLGELNGNNPREYTPRIDIESLKIAISQICTVDEIRSKRSPLIYSETKSLQLNDRIYFIGFGYDDFNLESLSFKKDIINIARGTAIGIPALRNNKIIDTWGIKLFDSNQEEFLTHRELQGRPNIIISFFQNFAPLE